MSLWEARSDCLFGWTGPFSRAGSGFESHTDDSVSSNSSRTLLDIMQGVKSLPLFAVSSKFEDSLGENKGIVALHCEKTLP